MSDVNGQRWEQLVAAEPSVPPDEPREMRACEVVDRWEESPRYLGVRARVPEELADAHQRPGQYVTLDPGTREPRFLVIASAPQRSTSSDGALESTVGDDRAHWEFLVDRSTELGHSLESTPSGHQLDVSAPEGSGYPTEPLEGRPLYCFTTGSGIASIHPVAECYRRELMPRPSRMAIYHGEFSADDHPYRDRSDEWGEVGIRVVRCDESTAPARYVQQAFQADAPPLDGAVVFLSGAPVMKRAVLEMLESKDVPLDNVYTNI